MSITLRRLVLALLLLTGTATASLAADPARYMSAELIAESLAPAPGSTILVGLRLTPKPGWHGYWSNPGDAGFAPTIGWSVPDGVAFGALLHPAPKLISAAGISSYVHEGEHILLSRMTVPRGIAPGTPIRVAARASWAACTATMCVPLKATFTLDLTAGSGARSPDAAALSAATRKLPQPVSGGAFSSDGESVRLVLPAALRLDPGTTRFFPDDNDAFKTASGRAEAGKLGLVIVGSAEGNGPRSISGVATDGRFAYRLTLTREEPEAAAAKPGVAAKVETGAQRPAAAPVAERSKSETQAGSEEAPALGLWAMLLLATALVAGAVVARRRRSS